MKIVKLIPIIVLMLTVNILNAQSTGLEGSYLNIGTNTLIENNAHLWGNAMGVNNYVGSANTLAVGNSDTIGGNSVNAIALGGMNSVQGTASMAFGNTVKINGDFSYGIGRYLRTNANHSIVIGHGIAGSGQNLDVFFENNNANSLMIGFHSTKPTLTIGPSPNDYPHGNNFGLTGKVAIGDVPVSEIAAKLHIRSDAGEDAGIFLEPGDMETAGTFIKLRDDSHGVWVDRNGVMSLKSMDGIQYAPLFISGKVGINVSNPNKLVSGYALCVHGGIITEKVNIQSYSDWPDYVFTPDYVLMPLSQLKGYIMEHRHLPDIPSEQEVLDQGVEVGEMQGLLLKKIEELTLYSIQLQEQVELLQKEIDKLKNR